MDQIDKFELERRKLWFELIDKLGEYCDLVDEHMVTAVMHLFVETAFAVCDPHIVDEANVALEPWRLQMVHLLDPDE
jgi:hypothetical protein